MNGWSGKLTFVYYTTVIITKNCASYSERDVMNPNLSIFLAPQSNDWASNIV